MTREELKKLIDHIEFNIEINKEVTLTNDDCREIIKALKQEPCVNAISRQAVLDQIYNWSKDEFLRTTNSFDYLRKRINGLPSVKSQEPKTRWIPVSEKLPEEHKEVLTCGWGGFIEIQSTELNYWKDQKLNYCWENQNGVWSDIDDVIAWMPLPSPYEPQESEVKNADSN